MYAAKLLLLVFVASSTIPGRLGVKDVHIDHFTKMLYSMDLTPASNEEKEQIDEAWNLLNDAKSHCAMKLVARAIKKDGVTVVFQQTEKGQLAQCDYPKKELQVYPYTAFVRAPQNLSKLIYHEGLHHLEYVMEMRKLNTGNWHDSTNIQKIIARLEKDSGSATSCSNLVREDGTLFWDDGTLVEPSFEKAIATPDPNECPFTDRCPCPYYYDPSCNRVPPMLCGGHPECWDWNNASCRKDCP